MFINHNNTERWVNRIKLVLVLFIAFSWQLVEAQNSVLEQIYSFKFQELTVSQALNQITTQTGFIFIFNAAKLQKDNKINFTIAQKPLTEILNQIFQDTTLSYKLIDKYIVVTQKVFSEKKTASPLPDSILIIKGKVIDHENKQPLAYATVGILYTSTGTITNTDGQFVLKIPEKYRNSVILISYLGYDALKIQVEQLASYSVVFELIRNVVSLPEIIIRNPDPLRLISKSIKNFKQNYRDKPCMMTGFYRESIRKDNDYQIVSEAVLTLYKSAYFKIFDNDQIKIQKARKFEKVKPSDTLIIKLKGGLYSCLLMDIIKNTPDFLIESNFSDYIFGSPDIAKYNDESAYIIPFEQRAEITEPYYTGQIYLNMRDLAVIGASFQINPKYINQLKDKIVHRNRSKINVSPQKVEYRVTYRQIDNYYYFNHIWCEMIFKTKKKFLPFSHNYTINFEMLTNDLDTIDIQHFARNEADELKSIFADVINDYDENFWGKENIIQPDEPLEKALIRFSKKVNKKKK